MARLFGAYDLDRGADDWNGPDRRGLATSGHHRQRIDEKTFAARCADMDILPSVPYMLVRAKAKQMT